MNIRKYVIEINWHRCIVDDRDYGGDAFVMG